MTVWSPSRPALLRGATVIAGGGDPPQPMDVLLRDGSIAAVGAELSVPEDAQIVDVAGRWITPGLIDAHVHSTDLDDMAAYVRNGVTTIRYAGTAPGAVEELRRRLGNAPRPAPRLLTCGPMLDVDPPSYPHLSAVVRNPDHARTVVDDLVTTQDLDGLIVVQGITPGLLRAIVETASAHDLPVVGQTWHTDGAEAAAAGITQLDNTSRILASTALTTDELTDYSSVAERIAMLREAWATIDWEATQRIIETMVAAGVYYCPTLVRTQWAAGVGPGTLQRLQSDRDAALFGDAAVDRWTDNVGGTTDRTTAVHWGRALDNVREWMARFVAAGGQLTAGTDTQFGGIMLHDELANLRGVGLDAAAVLDAATAASAEALRPSTPLGRIAPGHAADLLILPADPLSSPTVLRGPETVVLAGRPVDPTRPDRFPPATTTQERP